MAENKVNCFASIYIGTAEISMKVFELSQKKRVRKVDDLKKRSALGHETFAKERVSAEALEELCACLMEFLQILEGYRATAYAAYAGPFLSDADNAAFVLEQVRIRTGIRVEILSNSEQRFLSYKSVACREEFDGRVAESAAVVDIGGSSVQITLFREGGVVTTQHLLLGTLRIREKLSEIQRESMASYKQQIVELVDKEMDVFRTLFLTGSSVGNMILIGEYCSDIVKKVQKKHADQNVDVSAFLKYVNKLVKKGTEELAKELNIVDETDPRLLPSLFLVKRITEVLNPREVWVPGSNISDGIAYDFAQKKKVFPVRHSFDRDITTAAVSLAERYQSYSPHVRGQVELCGVIFDALKKLHGMGKRERLLMETAAILHDCGKYISSVDAAASSYHIIMASEIIGLTHQEREVVASSVLYNVHPLPLYEELADRLNEEEYRLVAKISAILRLSNALDRSHKQKIRRLSARLSGRELILTARTEGSIGLERNVLDNKAEEFERVYGIRPVLKSKRVEE